MKCVFNKADLHIIRQEYTFYIKFLLCGLLLHSDMWHDHFDHLTCRHLIKFCGVTWN